MTDNRAKAMPAASQATNGDTAHLQALLDDRLAEIRRQVDENRRIRALNDTLRVERDALRAERDRLAAALRDLADRCDRAELADGSSLDTTQAHAALGDLDHVEPEETP
jgi:transcription elongation GreA/GreB family factor